MRLAIETAGLGKSYGDVRAVRDLSLKVEEGELYAFLGLNGAGKTTTIRMLLGMIRPTTGIANVLGRRVSLGSREPWGQVGYLVETPRAYPELSVRENLEAARKLHPGTSVQRVNDVIERLALTEYVDRPAGNLSQGNAQRLGLAKALLHQPRLLFLDEPANGLDPAGIVEIRALLRELTEARGVTVFMSSHILAEVARLARRIGIIHEGRLLQELSMEELDRNRRRSLLVRARDTRTAQRVLAEAGEAFEVDADGTITIGSPSACDRPEEVNRRLVEAGAAPTHLTVEEEELERYFLRLVGTKGAMQRV